MAFRLMVLFIALTCAGLAGYVSWCAEISIRTSSRVGQEMDSFYGIVFNGARYVANLLGLDMTDWRLTKNLTMWPKWLAMFSAASALIFFAWPSVLLAPLGLKNGAAVEDET